MQGALWSAHRVHVHPRCGREGVEADKDLATRPEAEVQALGDLSVSAGNGEGSTGDAKASTEAETAGGSKSQPRNPRHPQKLLLEKAWRALRLKGVPLRRRKRTARDSQRNAQLPTQVSATHPQPQINHRATNV